MTKDEMIEFLRKPYNDGWKNNPRADKDVIESIARVNREHSMTAAEAKQMVDTYRANAQKLRTTQSKGK